MKRILLLGLLVLSLLMINSAFGQYDWSGDWGLESCYQPGLLADGVTYEYVDGLNNSFDDWTGTYNVTDETLNATIKARLGVTGLTKIVGIHYHDTSTKDRGLAYLYEDDTVSPSTFISVWQWNEKAWTVPGLARYANGSSVYYSNGLDIILFEESAGAAGQVQNWTAGKLSVTFLDGENGTCNYYGTSQCVEGVFEGYMFGNTTSFYIATEIYDQLGYVALRQTTLNPGTKEGSWTATTNYASICGGCNKWYAYMYYGNSTTVISGGPAGRHPQSESGGTSGDGYHKWLLGSGSTYADAAVIHEKNYWGCTVSYGKVLFNTYAGSATCEICEAYPTFPCIISSETLDLPAGTASNTSSNVTAPDFANIQGMSEDGEYWIINHEWMAGFTTETKPRFQKYVDHVSTLTLDYQRSGGAQLTDSLGVALIAYNPPTGNINNIDLTALTINTTLVTDSAVCYCETPWGCHNYTFGYIVGYNETHFKRVNFTCLNGAGSLSNASYSSSISAITTSEEYAMLTQLGKVGESALDPLHIDSDNEHIERFFLWNLDFQAGTRSVDENFIAFGDNENFLLEFNYSDCGGSNAISSDLVYGTYDYNCVLPAGYVDGDGTSIGNVTIDAPLETVVLRLEKYQDLDATLKVLSQGAPAVGAFCLTDTGLADTAGINGYCNFPYLEPNTNLTVSITYGGYTQDVVFCVSDYYNSDGCGIGVKCGTFDGTYEYVHDIGYGDLGVPVRFGVTDFDGGAPIEGAVIYWDGVELTETNENGHASGFVAPNYTRHNVLIIAECYANASDSVILRTPNERFDFMMVRISGCEPITKIEDIDTSAGVITLLGNMEFIGVLIVILSGVAGASAGVAGIALGLGGSAFLLALVGTISWFWAVPLLFLAVIVGAVGWTGILSGKQGGG